MKTKFLILFLLLNYSFAGAQKKIRDVVEPPPPPTFTKNDAKVDEALAQMKNLVFVINIDGKRNVTLTVQTAENGNFLADSSQTKSLTAFFSGFAELQNRKAASKPKNIFEPILIVKADLTLTYNQVSEVINAARTSPSQKIQIQISKYISLFIPTKAETKTTYGAKPNPLMLLVNLDKNLNLTLNNENEGSLNDTAQLEKRLAQIFKDREANGMFRVGNNEVEKTTFIKAPLSADFAEIIKLATALRNSGADLIGLQMDGSNQ